MYKRIDLSHIIEDGMITYKGLPAPIICDYFSHEESKAFYEEGTEFQIGKIEMVANTGTYVDVPSHRFRDGKDLTEIGLDKLAFLEAIMIDATQGNGLAIDASFFEGKEIENKAVIIRTDWSRHWRTDQYFENHPFLTKDAAIYLVKHKAILVGIDSHNIDNTSGGTRPVHTILLSSEIPIVEHLCNLDAVGNASFYFTAAPPKIKSFGTFPVRAFALVGKNK